MSRVAKQLTLDPSDREYLQSIAQSGKSEHRLVGGRGGFYTNARVKIGHWRHQMHTILAHSYPSVAS